jgi:hypothetical protein
LKKRPPKTNLTVEDILSAPAEYDHTLEVRSIAPAIVLVLEQEAPMRLEAVASTRAEFEALLAWCSNTPQVREILDLFYAVKAEEEGTELSNCWRREDEHAERLESGQRLLTLRVTA